MSPATALLVLLAVPAQTSATVDGAKAKNDTLLALHTGDAAGYTIYRDPAKTQKLTLRREPVYRWTNPTRVGGQVGDVFVWTYKGRPEVIGSIFSHPHHEGNQRVVCHELHSLSTAVLVVDRASPNRWEPQAPGVDLKPVPGAPAPAGSAPRRLAQLRSMAREFSGRSLSDRGEKWELRLLPQPLYRYESTDPEVPDGALFALVSSAGTDPEVVLLIEDRRDGTGGGPRWVFGAARFSDMNLWLNHKDREVWTSIRGGENTFHHDAGHRFRFYQDRIIPEVVSKGP